MPASTSTSTATAACRADRPDNRNSIQQTKFGDTIMSTNSINRRAVLTIAAASLGLTAVIATPSQAAPVEYVKICSLYGAGFFYIPGSDTCTNANQIATNQFD